jgi:hypothetical protein
MGWTVEQGRAWVDRAAASRSPVATTLALALAELEVPRAELSLVAVDRRAQSAQVLAQLDETPYVYEYNWGACTWGLAGSGDCSGFVSMALRRSGCLPDDIRLTTKTLDYLPRVGLPEVGDVVLIRSGHVGIVMVPGRYVLDSGGEGKEATPDGHLRLSSWPSSPVYYRPARLAGPTPGLRAWLAYLRGGSFDAAAYRAGYVEEPSYG